MSKKKASPAVAASNKSNSRKQNPKFDDIFATVKAEQEFDRVKRNLYEERIQIWKKYSERIEPLRRAWFEAWRKAASNLSDVNAVVDSLLPCNGIIEELDKETASWHQQASEWMERVKNNNLGNQFQLLYPSHNSSWGEYSLMLWAEGIIKGNGLKKIISNLYTNFRIPINQEEKYGLTVLRLISQGASRGQLIQYLGYTNSADVLSGVTAALTMVVIPPEDHYTFEPFELPQTEYILEKARNLIAIAFAQYDSRIGRGIAEQYIPLPIPETVQPAQEPCVLPATVKDTVEPKPDLPASNSEAKSDDPDQMLAARQPLSKRMTYFNQVIGPWIHANNIGQIDWNLTLEHVTKRFNIKTNKDKLTKDYNNWKQNHGKGAAKNNE